MNINSRNQWFKRFESGNNAFEIAFDPCSLLVITKIYKDGQLTEKKQSCTQIIAGVWAYNKELAQLKKIYPEMKYVVPEGTNRVASQALAEFLEDKIYECSASKAKKKIQSLIRDGADVNLSHRAIGQGIFEALIHGAGILKIFIGHGATIDAIERRLTAHCIPGSTPIHKAILRSKGSKRYWDKTELLKNAGADLDFHLDIAIQMSLLHFDSMARNGKKWDEINGEYQDTWAMVVERLLEWGARPAENYAQLQSLVDRGITPYEQSIEDLKDFAAKEWSDNARESIRSFSTNQLDTLILEVLFLPAAIQHSGWSGAVAEIFNVQPAFEDIAEKAYGQRVSIDEDEGWLCQSWGSGSYSNFRVLLQLLQQPAAVKHKNWNSFVKKIIDGCEIHDCDKGDIENFFNNPLVQTHKKNSELLQIFKNKCKD